MGDIVLTSPVLRCLSIQTKTEIHFLTKSVFADLINQNPYVHRVWTFDKEPDALFEALRAETFDFIIDLHNNLRSLKVALALRRPVSRFPKLRLARFLLTTLGVDMMPKQHIVMRYMQAVQRFGVNYDGAGLDYFIPESTTLPQSDLLSKGKYIVFAVGATHFTKRLPTQHIITLCKNQGLPVVLVGGQQEATTGKEIEQACGAKVLNLCGMLTLHQSALAVRNAQIVLTHDTGMMHIAAAFGKPIHSFWGSTHTKLGFWPFYRDGIDLNTSHENTKLACRPCTKFGRAACPKGHFNCMRDLDLTAAFSADNHIT